MGGARNLVLGRVAGVLFLAGALAAVPSNLLLSHPDPPAWVPFLNLFGALTGVACLLAPWDRMHRRWLHLVPPVAVAEVAISVIALGEHGDVYLSFFVLNAVYVGYAFRKRREVAAHMAVSGAGILCSALYASSFDVDAVPRAMVTMPTIWVAAGVVVWLRENLERRERTDPLTGLGNRRALMEALEEACERREPRLLVLFDLDGFKRYNDRLGHAAGDALLERLGLALNEAVDESGEAFRLGGDELCVLLGDPEALADCELALREDGIGASYGSAWITEEADTPSSALSLADDRMYAAKRAARDAPFVLSMDSRPDSATAPQSSRAPASP